MDKTANVAVIVGKRSFTPEQITENTVAAINALIEQRPKASVGKYIKSLTLSSTMSPGLAVDVTDFNKA
jgi:large subunit ribosomal protein L1